MWKGPTYTVARRPSFFAFWLMFNINIHVRGRAAKNGEGLHGNTYHMNDTGGHEVDEAGEGRGPHSNNVLDFIIKRSTARQDFRCSWLIKKTHSQHVFVVRHRPPFVHLMSTSRGKCSQGFPIFHRFSASVIYWIQTKEQKHRGSLEQEHRGSLGTRTHTDTCTYKYIHVQAIQQILLRVAS